MNIQDRRVRKTKNALMEALIRLMAEKELRNITVRELTDTADVHRATFYVHYKDVYDLYEKLEDSVVEELSRIVSGDSAHSYESIYKALIEYVFENKTLCKMFFGNAVNRSFQRRVNTVLEDSYLKAWLYEDRKTEITERMRFLTEYNIQGCNAMIGRWIEEGFSCPKETVIDLLKTVNDNFDTVI